MTTNPEHSAILAHTRDRLTAKGMTKDKLVDEACEFKRKAMDRLEMVGQLQMRVDELKADRTAKSEQRAAQNVEHARVVNLLHEIVKIMAESENMVAAAREVQAFVVGVATDKDAPSHLATIVRKANEVACDAMMHQSWAARTLKDIEPK